MYHRYVFYWKCFKKNIKCWEDNLKGRLVGLLVTSFLVCGVKVEKHPAPTGVLTFVFSVVRFFFCCYQRAFLMNDFNHCIFVCLSSVSTIDSIILTSFHSSLWTSVYYCTKFVFNLYLHLPMVLSYGKCIEGLKPVVV